MKRRTARPGALPVHRVEARPGTDLQDGAWPATVPAVAQLLREGLNLAPVTILVGENGSGKSTLVEAIAQAYGLSPEGGTTQAMHSTRVTESPLHDHLRIVRGIGAARWGFFLRAETMHGLYTYLEDVGIGGFHDVSHGESFLSVLQQRFDSPGFYVLDEPESALSFSGCLALVGVILELVAARTSQVLLSTHSPVLAAVPGATILELDGDGYHRSTWDDLPLVTHHRAFLADPERYLRHVRP